MLDAMFDIPSSAKPSKEFRVTLDYARAKLSKNKMSRLKVA
jgi:hypothetical protein